MVLDASEVNLPGAIQFSDHFYLAGIALIPPQIAQGSLWS